MRNGIRKAFELLRSLAKLGDVTAGDDDVAFAVAIRIKRRAAPGNKPAILPFRQPKLFAILVMLPPSEKLPGGRRVLQKIAKRLPMNLGERVSGQLLPLAIHSKDSAFRIQHKHEAGHGIENRRDEIALRFQERGLPLRLLPLPVHLDKCRYLRLQDVRLERLEQIVDASQRIPLAHMHVALADRSEKNNWSVPRLLALSYESCSLETVHIGHFYIEQNDRSIILEKKLQGFGARRCPHEILPKILEDCLERYEILASVINEQDVYFVGHISNQELLPQIDPQQ